jgi:dTDP-4-amino-4,6-dideoxygalactose transaminase
VGRRERVAEALTAGLDGLDGLRAPMVREGCRHNYYCWCVRYDESAMGLSRDAFCKALAAEGFPLGVGYVRPLYLLPLFQERIAIGAEGFPFSLSNRTYAKGLCPVAERLHEKEAFLFEPCAWSLDERHTELLVEALRKVHGRAGELAALEREGEAASA